jgi:LysM repeat protein
LCHDRRVVTYPASASRSSISLTMSAIRNPRCGLEGWVLPRKARTPQFLLLTSGLKIQSLAPSCPGRDGSRPLATKPEKIIARRPAKQSVVPMEMKALPAALLRIAPVAESEPSATRWKLIVPGVMVVFGLLIGGNYWVSEKGRVSVAAQATRPINTSAKTLAVIGPPPMGRSAPPPLSVGLRPLGSQPEPAEEAPVQTLSQSVEDAPRYITILEGQSLSRIGRANHLSISALAAANHLERPYKLKAGSQLILPNSAPPPIQQAKTSRPLPPASLRSPTSPRSPKQIQTVATATQEVPPSALGVLPDIVPVDGPPKEIVAPQPPQKQAQAQPVLTTLPKVPPVLPPRNPAAALPLPGEAESR